MAALPVGTALLDVIEVRRYRPRKEGQRLSDHRVYLAFIVRKDGSVSRFNMVVDPEEKDPGTGCGGIG